MNPLNTKGAALNRIIKELEKIETTRLGWITQVDLAANVIWVDYEQNPTRAPMPAKLSNKWIYLEDIEDAIRRKASAQIDFENGNPLKPIIREIFYPVSSNRKTKQTSLTNSVVHIEAEEIILTGKKKVVIQSGNVKTTYLAEGGELTTEAEQIDSSANKNQRIKGGSLFLN